MMGGDRPGKNGGGENKLSQAKRTLAISAPLSQVTPGQKG
jgi:hypothetical protein